MVDEQPGQIEHARHPRYQSDDMERFDPRVHA
jgi:hypothetical protein